MTMFPDDEFMAWFFTYFTDDVTCPHCEAVIFEDEISEKRDDFVVCPHCSEKISKDNIEEN